MKRILFVINTLGMGGAERSLMTLLKALPDRDTLQVDLLVITGQGELKDNALNRVNILNKKIDKTPVLSEEGRERLVMRLVKRLVKRGLKRGKLIKAIPYMWINYIDMLRKGHVFPEKLLWRLYAESTPVVNKEYDLAISYIEGASAYYTANKVRAKKKALFVHVDYKKAGYGRLLDKDDIYSFDRIFAVSGDVKESFLKVYPKLKNKVRVFENIIDSNEVKKKALQPGGFDDGFRGIRILSISRLTYQKGIDTAVKAMGLLIDAGYNVRWYVIGDGDYSIKIYRLIKKTGLLKDFILLGTKENPLNYLKQCHIFVNSSRYEGKSIALREAMILGKPIVLSDAPGNRGELKDGKEGLYYKGFERELFNTIKELLEDDTKMRELGKAVAENYRDDKVELKDLLELLK